MVTGPFQPQERTGHPIFHFGSEGSATGDVFKASEEEVEGRGAAEQRFAAVTAEGDEMRESGVLISAQSAGHGEDLKP